MWDQNLNLANRYGNRGGFFTGVGALCVTAIVLAGCAGLSKKKASFAATEQTSQVETEKARLAKSERARKAAVQKLARALANNKTLKKQLADAKNTTKKFRDEFQAADKDIADLEVQLAKAKAQPAESEDSRSAVQQSEQLAANLKTRLDKANIERDVLKAQLDEAQKDSSQVIEKMLTAASREAKQSRAENEKLTGQVQTAQAEVASVSESNRIVHVLYRKSVKENAELKQAAAKQTQALRDQLAVAKQQISDAQAAAKAARIELATANAEMARIKAAQ